MYALIQLRAPASHRARIIAANNILNAMFMIASSVIVGALLSMGFTIPQVFGLTALANALVALYIFLLVPEYLLRFVAFIAVALRLPLQGARRRAHPDRGRGDHRLQPRQLRRRGAADGGQPAADPLRDGPSHLRDPGARLALQAGARRSRWRRRRKTRRPTPPPFEAADRVLADGDLLGIFPEGGITRDGAAAAVQGRHHEDPRAPAGAGGAGGAAKPVGSYFSRIERRHGDEPSRFGGACSPASGWWPGPRCPPRR